MVDARMIIIDVLLLTTMDAILMLQCTNMHVFIHSAANLSFCMFFLNINAIYIDASGTLRFRGFFENDAPNASLPKNAPASLRALDTLLQASVEGKRGIG